jgi:hypothetical protein
MSKVERTFMIDADAAALLVQLAGGPRKQGEFLSEMIRREARKDPLAVQVEALRRELARVEAELERRAAAERGPAR